MKTPISSIHYPFAIDAGVGRLAEEVDYAEHVEQLMKQVLFTNPGERVNRPDFGCGLRRMVFAPNSEAISNLTQITVLEALETWLGSVIKVNKVEIRSVNEVLHVNIAYVLKAKQERRYLNLEVTL